MAEHTHYDSTCRVGCHHLALELARKGHQITYLSSCLTPLHLCYLPQLEIRRRFRNWFAGGHHFEQNLYAYVPFSILPFTRKPLLDAPWIANHQLHCTLPPLPKKLSQRGPFDALLIGDPRFIPLIDQIKAPVNILRLTDNMLGIATTPRSVKQLIKIALSKCNYVIVTAHHLSKLLEEWFGFRDAIHMPNGVDLNHFGHSALTEPEDFAQIPIPRVIYAGNVDTRLDLDLLHHCANTLPHVSFVLLGPIQTSLTSIRSCPNIHILGPRTYSQIPHYFAASQAAMIPFHSGPHIDSICSIKLLQYLAAGLPTVATRWKELEFQKPPIYIAYKSAEFAAYIQKAVSEPSQQELYRSYAKQYPWEKNIEILEKLCTANNL
jgi:glycosyltransferase involved in cell wall biosynthesis